ncbi:MAG: N-acetyl-gamma-glutamyl-phosphate reductase, partial [Candidatus Lokiarchaeota archaeon]|nr:N-acetyl-gamma-glutamyl-phosphate reductase [Candidatus Lokiarchaeota archaeon]
MDKIRVFIDGQAGTTGLTIAERLRHHPGVECLAIPDEKRKDIDARLEYIHRSDLAILCLPDEASREIVRKLDGSDRIIDTSTAHRTPSGWVYGF